MARRAKVLCCVACGIRYSVQCAIWEYVVLWYSVRWYSLVHSRGSIFLGVLLGHISLWGVVFYTIIVICGVAVLLNLTEYPILLLCYGGPDFSSLHFSPSVTFSWLRLMLFSIITSRS